MSFQPKWGDSHPDSLSALRLDFTLRTRWIKTPCKFSNFVFKSLEHTFLMLFCYLLLINWRPSFSVTNTTAVVHSGPISQALEGPGEDRVSDLDFFDISAG